MCGMPASGQCSCTGALVEARAQVPGVPSPHPASREEARRSVSVDSRLQLFAVMCALDAAGYEPVAATGDTPGRIQVRKRLQALQGPAAVALRKYYAEHAVADSGATFSRFVSFALVVGPPPDFQFEFAAMTCRRKR